MATSLQQGITFQANLVSTRISKRFSVAYRRLKISSHLEKKDTQIESVVEFYKAQSRLPDLNGDIHKSADTKESQRNGKSGQRNAEEHHHHHGHNHHDHGHGHGHHANAPVITVTKSAKSRNQELSIGAGVGKLLFIDAYTSGIAGDMFLASLMDLGVPPEVILQGLRCVDLDGYFCEVVETEKSAIVAPHFIVREDVRHPQRTYADIKSLLANSRLPPGAKSMAEKAFKLLAEAEASVHGVETELIHFHEVGAVDSIVDIIGVCIALDYIKASEIVVSPLPISRGIIKGANHGPLPNPAPATLSLICSCHLATFFSEAKGELVTPTGACLVGAVANDVSAWPSMTPQRCSYGAGTRDLSDRPNLLRLVLGERV